MPKRNDAAARDAWLARLSALGDQLAVGRVGALITLVNPLYSGKPLGEEIYSTAQEGRISEVNYMWPRTGGTDPVQKVSYVTRVGDQVCAVGYYK